jgi:hypothetical protein
MKNMKNFKTINDYDTFDLIINRLKKYNKGDKFYYVRYGDADIYALYPEEIGTIGGRSNQFLITKELQQELYNTWNIVDDDYWVAGSLNLDSINTTDGGPKMHNRIKELMDKKIIAERFNFYSHPTFESNFVYKPEKFLEFTKLLYNKKKLWVNQYWHENIETILGNIEHHVQTPSTNSYENIDDWFPEILKVIDNVEVVILASGFSSRVLAGRLWELGINKIVIDPGSVVDMFIANTWIINHINLRSTMTRYRSEILKSLEYILNQSKLFKNNKV